jgi:hypothetical protein
MVGKLKVFSGCLDGRNRLSVAAANQKEAAELMRTSLHSFRQYCCETRNDDDVARCLANPGTVFKQKI